jgi:hypothetical protein
MPHHRKSARIGYEGRVVLLALLAGLPGSACALMILWTGDYAARTQWTLTILIVCAWLGFAMAVRERVVFPYHVALPARLRSRLCLLAVYSADGRKRLAAP